MGIPLAVAELEAAVLDACAGEDEWQAQIAAGIYAAVDFAIARPQLVEAVSLGADPMGDHERIITRFTAYIQARAPVEKRLPGTPDATLVAGMVGLVGDHLRLGRIERLSELRADLVLLALLPYLGFLEAQKWANRVEENPPVS